MVLIIIRLFYMNRFGISLVFILLILLRRVNLRRGELFLSYVIWYSVGRFFIEGLRTDSLMIGGLRMAQSISIALIIGAAIILIYRRKKNLAKDRYQDKNNQAFYAVKGGDLEK